VSSLAFTAKRARLSLVLTLRVYGAGQRSASPVFIVYTPLSGRGAADSLPHDCSLCDVDSLYFLKKHTGSGYKKSCW